MSAAVWEEGPLPAGVEVGEDVTIERHENTFKRFFSVRRPGLVLGDRVRVFTWSSFSVEPDAVVTVGHDTVLVGAQFMCGERIEIGARVVVSYNVAIADSDFHPVDVDMRRGDTIALAPEIEGVARPPVEHRPVVIEDDVRIGMGAMILKGVRIGRGATVAPGSVVTSDVPAGVTVEGNPAREALIA